MIRDFDCSETEKLWTGKFSKKFHTDIQKRALTKLRFIHAATSINDLRFPPSNHLEQLKGDYKGFHSIRVTAQWRIVFVWENGGADHVSIVV